MLSQVVELIEKKQRFAVTSHERPDGDSLGSSLGLYWLLTALGKKVDVVMSDTVPASYAKLPGADQIRVCSSLPESYDAVFVIECSELDRPGIQDLATQFIVNIDHHTTAKLFGSINWIDTTASAVGEMIYNLCKAIGVRPNKQIAECIYTALITDTGSFHYANTTERTFKVASELVKAGVKPVKVAQKVFNSHPWNKLELLREVLSTARRDGGVVVMRQTLDMQRRTQSAPGDGDNFVQYPMSVGEVKAVAFLKETGPGAYRASLRSKGSINVARVAEMLGGGGHVNASGCNVYGSWEEAEEQLINLLKEEVERDSNGDGDDFCPSPACVTV